MDIKKFPKNRSAYLQNYSQNAAFNSLLDPYNKNHSSYTDAVDTFNETPAYNKDDK